MDTIRINVPLTKLEAQALIALAEREKRHPREQAAYLIACGLLIHKLELQPTEDDSSPCRKLS